MLETVHFFLLKMAFQKVTFFFLKKGKVKIKLFGGMKVKSQADYFE